MKCDICKETIGEQSNGWKFGHNAEPIVMFGRCCDVCNSQLVIPARIMESATAGLEGRLKNKGENDEK